jgi:hypothetical protein
MPGSLPPGVRQHQLPGCDPRLNEEDVEVAWAELCCDNCGCLAGLFRQRGKLKLCVTCANHWDIDPEEVE